jgi:hypothetical protein
MATDMYILYIVATGIPASRDIPYILYIKKAGRVALAGFNSIKSYLI